MPNYPTIDSCNDDWQRLLYTTAYSNGFEKAREAIFDLHKPVNGPYDDVACEWCTALVHSVAEWAGITEPVYIEYPCATVVLLGGNNE